MVLSAGDCTFAPLVTHVHRLCSEAGTDTGGGDRTAAATTAATAAATAATATTTAATTTATATAASGADANGSSSSSPTLKELLQELDHICNVEFPARFAEVTRDHRRRKLGFSAWQEETDQELWERLDTLMETSQCDFTLLFRELAQVAEVLVTPANPTPPTVFSAPDAAVLAAVHAPQQQQQQQQEPLMSVAPQLHQLFQEHALKLVRNTSYNTAEVGQLIHT
jgi:uncharacterized protein YdiU (UPF0061 family)